MNLSSCIPKIGSAATLAVVLMCAGCALTPLRAPVIPPGGLIFTQYSAPLDIHFSEEGEGTSVTYTRMGESETSYLFIPLIGFLTFAWGDGSLDTAAKNGRIQQINYADYELLSVLGVYANVKFRAYGE